ncbi:MAG: ASPIC/UnbV domain-containing protein [Verrucomicrobiales bacterium]
MKSGKSFSGRERHCSFLNLHNETFANISAVSGLDWPDDGRSAATVDWDRDGDLDICVANRTGPQLRILQNDFPGRGGHLTVSLVGDTCNRDAIGARLELFVDGEDLPMIRSLRAGDGFLSQSSKSIHFGLGQANAIDRLVVHWPGPGGSAQTIQDLEIGEHYRITQGRVSAEVLQKDGAPKLKPAPVASSPSPLPPRIFTHAPIPLPKLNYSPSKGDKDLPMVDGRPVLINLWASWCAPCLEELQAFAKESAPIRKFGLDILALSVDLPGDDLAKAERFLESCDWPFRSGSISTASIDRLQNINNFVLDIHTPLPVPTSFLVDNRGNLQGIFKGPVEVTWLLENVGRLVRMPTSGEGRSKGALPFPGRWFTDPRRLNYIGLAIELAESAPIDTALEYYSRNKQIFEQSPRAPKLLFSLAQALESKQRLREAELFYRRALAISPNYIDSLHRFASLLSRPASGEAKEKGTEAVVLAEKAAALTGFQNPHILQTLATAYANLENYPKAIGYAEAALLLAREQGLEKLAAIIETHLQSYQRNERPETDVPQQE